MWNFGISFLLERNYVGTFETTEKGPNHVLLLFQNNLCSFTLFKIHSKLDVSSESMYLKKIKTTYLLDS
jgi:hypothetical protein